MRTVQSISITIPTNLVEKLDEIQKEEMKTCSGIITEAIRQYVEWQQFKKIQKELSLIARAKKIMTAEDINRILHKSR
jgi:metal-responsive CopG/Arc/MetJ family transcriptional regulator